MTTGWYDEPDYTKLRYIKYQFVSYKTLDGNKVVKGSDEPINSVILNKEFNEDQELTAIDLYFSNGQNDNFRSEVEPRTNIYKADMLTLVYNGYLTEIT